MTSCVVLGGGGFGGIAWEIGVLLGLRDEGVDLFDADRIVGTSAGSVVGSAMPDESLVTALWEAHFAPQESLGSLTRAATARMLLALSLPGAPTRRRARLGALALRAPLASSTAMPDLVRERVPKAWPDHDLRICAVEAQTGRFRGFTRHSGVDLHDAVAASCAVPLVFAPVVIDGVDYIDGGFRTVANADLAVGCDRVVVIAPLEGPVPRYQRITTQLSRLGADSRSRVVRPDRGSAGAIGRDFLGTDRRAAIAWAGRTQGRQVAPEVAQVWRRT